MGTPGLRPENVRPCTALSQSAPSAQPWELNERALPQLSFLPAALETSIASLFLALPQTGHGHLRSHSGSPPYPTPRQESHRALQMPHSYYLAPILSPRRLVASLGTTRRGGCNTFVTEMHIPRRAGLKEMMSRLVPHGAEGGDID